MKTRIASTLITGSMLMILAACMNLGTSASSATRFYLLDSKPGPPLSSLPKGELSRLSIGVGPVTIPPYLDRPQIVTRVGVNELRPDDFHQWAEPIKANISRVMGENLALATGVRHTFPHPWKRSAAIDLQIAMDLLRFDADTRGRVTLTAVWRIFHPDDRRLLVERRSSITETSESTDTTHVVEAMSAALADLSREMADALVDVVQGEPGTTNPVGL